MYDDKRLRIGIAYFTNIVVVVLLPEPFREKRTWRNSTETQQSGHSLRSGLEVKNGRSSAKAVAPEWLRCGTIQEEMS